jgi:hypothetical protein
VTARAANQRPKPRKKFFHPKRLRDIVVGSAIDTLNLLVPATARRQYEDRHGQTGLTPAAQQRHPVNLREAEVQHHRVVRLRLCQEIGVFTVGGSVHRIAGLTKRGRQLLGQALLVFSNQNSHAPVPAYGCYSPGDVERHLNVAFTERSGERR